MASQPDLVGTTVRLDGEPTMVIGILPPDPIDDGILVPLHLQDVADERAARSLFVWARLEDGVALEQARAELEAIGRVLELEHPDTNRGWTVNTRPLQEEFVGPQARLVFGLMFAMAVAVLLVGCVNIANLLMARGVARQGEITIRMAIGASRWRLVRQLLVECGGDRRVGRRCQSGGRARRARRARGQFCGGLPVGRVSRTQSADVDRDQRHDAGGDSCGRPPARSRRAARQPPLWPPYRWPHRWWGPAVKPLACWSALKWHWQ